MVRLLRSVAAALPCAAGALVSDLARACAATLVVAFTPLIASSFAPSASSTAAMRRSGAEIELPHLGCLLESLGSPFKGQVPRFEDIGAVGDRERHAGILLRKEDRHSAPRQGAGDVLDLLDHDRGEPERRLVQEQAFGARDERSADRKHLLLAARHEARPLIPP